MNKLVLVFMVGIFWTSIEAINQDKKIIDISVPKAGTFLLMRTMELITGNYCVGTGIMAKTYTPSIPLIEEGLRSTGFLCLHLVYKQEYESFFMKNNIKLCFIVRDPRDQLVSQAFFMLNRFQDHGRFTFDSLLTALIGHSEKSPENVLYPYQDVKLPILSSNEYISHIKKFYEGFLNWKNSKICCTTKFEDLIGPLGGGTVELQKKEIKKIAEHIGVNLDEQEVTEISANIFGNTLTFREGQKGTWKTHFTKEHKEQFKDVAGDLLQRLGYEENNEW